MPRRIYSVAVTACGSPSLPGTVGVSGKDEAQFRGPPDDPFNVLPSSSSPMKASTFSAASRPAGTCRI